MFSHKVGVNSGPGSIAGASVTVADAAAVLQLGVDESYSLDIPAGGGNIEIKSQTVFGA